jgi:uncharacterized OB-fold protein
MKCESCGIVSDSDSDVCPNCGQLRKLVSPAVGAPGTVGAASASGSDEVRNSNPKPEVAAPELANPGRPPGQIIEGTGG